MRILVHPIPNTAKTRVVSNSPSRSFNYVYAARCKLLVCYVLLCMNNIISITRSKRGELSQFRVLMGPWKFLVLLSAVVVQEGLGSSEENPLRLLRHERAAIRLGKFYSS